MPKEAANRDKMKLHDWVAETGAPSLFSHLWVKKYE